MFRIAPSGEVEVAKRSKDELEQTMKATVGPRPV